MAPGPSLQVRHCGALLGELCSHVVLALAAATDPLRLSHLSLSLPRGHPLSALITPGRRLVIFNYISDALRYNVSDLLDACKQGI